MKRLGGHFVIAGSNHNYKCFQTHEEVFHVHLCSAPGKALRNKISKIRGLGKALVSQEWLFDLGFRERKPSIRCMPGEHATTGLPEHPSPGISGCQNSHGKCRESSQPMFSLKGQIGFQVMQVFQSLLKLLNQHHHHHTKALKRQKPGSMRTIQPHLIYKQAQIR